MVFIIMLLVIMGVTGALDPPVYISFPATVMFWVGCSHIDRGLEEIRGRE